MSDVSAVLQDEAIVAVENAISEDEFDALAFFSGQALPEDTVTVYADAATAYRLAMLRAKQEERRELEESEGISLTDEIEWVDPDEVDALKATLRKSAVTFHLRALAPAARDAIEKKVRATYPYVEGAENSEYNEAFNGNLIADTIIAVTNAAGKVDKNKWDAARAVAFGKAAQPSEFSKLMGAVFNVNYIGNAIDLAVNADFS